MSTWWVVAALAVGSVCAKLLGPLLVGGREPPPRLASVITLIAPALLASLVVSGAVADGSRLLLDERVLGVGVALGCLWFRLPTAVALAAGAATAALLRLAA